MRKVTSYLAIIGILVLLFGGYVLPKMVIKLEDYHLDSVQKSFDIEKVELNTSQIDFFQKLYRFSALVGEKTYEEKEVMGTKENQIYEQANECVMEFLGRLNINTELKFEKVWVTSFLLADFETEQLYPVWQYSVYSSPKEKYVFWIDEVTKKILGFQIPSDTLSSEKVSFTSCLKAIAEYYNFQEYRFQGYEDKRGWSGMLEVLHNTNKEYMYFPFCKQNEVFQFNIYGENLAVSHDAESFTK